MADAVSQTHVCAHLQGQTKRCNVGNKTYQKLLEPMQMNSQDLLRQ